MLKHILALIIFCVANTPAQAVWETTQDLIYGTAHTLDDSEVEFGLLAPLQYGISSDVTVAIHPILLLIGVPQITLRYRYTTPSDITASLDVGATWSFLATEDSSGQRDDGSCSQVDLGYPGTTELKTTISWEAERRLLLSGGTGFAVDFLDVLPIRYLVELHLSIHWLITPKDLLMLSGTTYVDVQGEGVDALVRPTGQLVYARALGSVSLAVGVAAGEFPIDIDAMTGVTLNVYPVLDLWWRF